MKKPVILCVDDEQVVLTSLKAQLKRHLGNDFRIETVDSGEEALELVQDMLKEDADFAIIISDHIMPGMKGDELLKQVHLLSEATLKIMLTGQASPEAIGNAINHARLYRYISKPWEQDDLNITIRTALDSFFQQKKLTEIEAARAQLLLQLQEYNEKLEDKILDRTREIERQKHIIEKKNEDITASINYARRIQNALLPNLQELREALPQSFVLFKPRDIVSGDFYWFARIIDEQQVLRKIVVAAVDCTGHGIPGAFMSMIGEAQLGHIVNERKIDRPDLILNELHKCIRKSLKQENSINQDGMDIALCVIDLENKILQYSGAKNPLYLIQQGELRDIKADKTSIGGQQFEEERNFTLHTFELNSPTTFYLFSDGYQDQFGGEQNKKFMVKRFRELLHEIHTQPMEQQQQQLDQTITAWKGQGPQTDDILVMGIQI